MGSSEEGLTIIIFQNLWTVKENKSETRNDNRKQAGHSDVNKGMILVYQTNFAYILTVRAEYV